jgi:uncharacterized surface protein with fasciclin (FAS1) repeats
MLRRSWLVAAAAVALSGCAVFDPPKNIVQTAAANPNFSTLTRLINEANLADTLSGTGPFTVFAPTDAAFARVPKATLDAIAKDKDRLRQVLTFHVVAGKVMAADVKPGNVKTVNGADLPLSRSGNFVGVDQALVTQADIQATNGVIHVIDQVLLPPAPARR